MRTGAAAAHRGYFHEATYYAAEEELLAVVVPFLRGGVEAGEPTVVSLGESHAELVRRAIPDLSGVTFLSGGSVYARPAGAIRSYREMLDGYVAAGAHQIRIIGELDPTTFGATWDSWARYESAINHAFDEFPLWSLCAYDTRTTPEHVLADVARTHPRSAHPDDRHRPSEHYVEPTLFLRDRRIPAPDPVQLDPPLVDLPEPTPMAARLAMRDADLGVLSAAERQDLILAVSEIVTNAMRYGLPPVRLRAWAGADRVVVEVTDGGTGPTDPYAGLLPAGDGVSGGLGLWLTHQLCDHVTLSRHDNGFAVRLIAGNPHDRSEPDPTAPRSAHPAG